MSLELWDSWPEVPVEHTKHVNQRGGFTNIDAYWIIQALTERFGPMGSRWGLTGAQYQIVEGVYLLAARFWYMLDDTVSEFPVHTGVRFKWTKDGEERVDEDAPKKAMTAAISKASSYLGLAHPIYLGQWDKGGPSRGGKASTGSGSPGGGGSSNTAALKRLKGKLDEEFGEGGLYDKEDGNLTEAASKKLAVVEATFGETSWKAIEAMPEANFKQLAKDNFNNALETVKARGQAASSTTDGSPPVVVEQGEVF
jgi:hypothetical protein